MSSSRRIAAAALVALLSAGIVGATAPTANAVDTTWGTSIRR